MIGIHQHLGSILILALVASAGSGGTRAHGSETWSARLDGVDRGNDEPAALVVDAHGATYVTGTSRGHGYYDILTVKYAADGRERWTARFSGGKDDSARAAALDPAGHLYVTGTSHGGPRRWLDYVTISYDLETGEVQWSAHYDGQSGHGPPKTALDRPAAIALDGNGNVYVTGASRGEKSGYDYATVKYNRAGSEQWVARYDGPVSGPDHATAISVDPAGHVYVTGRSMGNRHFDVATVKYDGDGRQQWVARYDGPVSRFDGAVAAAVAADGLYVVANSFGAHRRIDLALLRYEANGNLSWVARHDASPAPADPSTPTAPMKSDKPTALTTDLTGNVFVTGATGSTTGWDYLTVKYDPTGRLVWESSFDGGHGDDRAVDIALDRRGDVFVTGHVNSTTAVPCDPCPDYATIKYDGANGRRLWYATYDSLGMVMDVAVGLVISDHDIVVTGMSVDTAFRAHPMGAAPRDYLTVKYAGVAGRR